MEALRRLTASKFYLDANVFIYALEAVDPWAGITARLLAAIDSGRFEATTSELTLAECLVKPLELGRTEIAETYSDLLQTRPGLAVVPIDRLVLSEAARLRAEHRLPLADAIHLATAVRSGCKLFVTNDLRFRSVPGVSRVSLADLDLQR